MSADEIKTRESEPKKPIPGLRRKIIIGSVFILLFALLLVLMFQPREFFDFGNFSKNGASFFNSGSSGSSVSGGGGSGGGDGGSEQDSESTSKGTETKSGDENAEYEGDTVEVNQQGMEEFLNDFPEGSDASPFLEVLKCELSDGTEGRVLNVAIENKSKFDFMPIKLKFEFYDKDGNNVEEAYIHKEIFFASDIWFFKLNVENDAAIGYIVEGVELSGRQGNLSIKG
jgi:hypothetical protein